MAAAWAIQSSIFGFESNALQAASLFLYRPTDPFRYAEAKHSSGELRYINGIPVLLLRGTPDEMGEQIDTLALKLAALLLPLGIATRRWADRLG
jgi:hypothetical protein